MRDELRWMGNICCYLSNVVAVCWDIVHLDAVWVDLIPLIMAIGKILIYTKKLSLGIVYNRRFSLLGIFPHIFFVLFFSLCIAWVSLFSLPSTFPIRPPLC